MKFLSNVILFLFSTSLYGQPINDITTPKTIQEKSILAYSPIQERDIMWKKHVWRVLDVREKMNQPFMYPKAPFFEIITKAAEKGKLALYSPEDEGFSYNLSNEELNEMLYDRDTVEIYDTSFNVQLIPIENSLNYEDIKRIRIKEVWFFDSHTSTLRVRILGIAPMIEVNDESRNFKYERPLFWVAYNELRPILAKEPVFNGFNDNSNTSWEDLLEMRYFSSTIIKASNVHDRKIEGYLTGIDALLEAEKIKQEIFNFEHDLWSY